MVKVDIYIPKEPVHPYMRLRQALMDAYNSLTEAPMCVGAWTNAAGDWVQEGVSVITLITEESMIPYIKRQLQIYKKDGKQEAVLFTVSPTTTYLL